MTDKGPNDEREERFRRVEKVARRLEAALGSIPPVAFVLGSGLGGLADALESPATIPFAEIPGLPPPGVAGHAGLVARGIVAGTPVLLQQGRVHFYEGHPMETVVLLARGLALAGVRILVVTNAAGAVRPGLGPGDLMRITDHLNLMGTNPLIGPHHPGFGERFPDMSRAYDPRVGAILDETAKEAGIPIEKGVYAAFSGPSYETPAEIAMVRALGADAVGMSTVPEVIAAVQMGVKTGALSTIANSAAGMSLKGISHEEVLEVTARAATRLSALLERSLPALQGLAMGAR